MPESTLTPEQANELSAKQELADALADVRKHASYAAAAAQETLDSCDKILGTIPDDVTADNLDLHAIGAALAVATTPTIEEMRALKGAIACLQSSLDDADDKHGYLVEGDFSDA